MIHKSYLDCKGCKGLYILCDPKTVKKRNMILDTWRNIFCKDAYQILGPVLVPEENLKRSQHLDQFKEQLFKVEGTNLYLRPETASSTFGNLKTLRRFFKGNPLKVFSIGKAFRNESSTRCSSLRRVQFDQIELHVISKELPFYDMYKPLLDLFFKEIGLDVSYQEVSNKPHYSLRTVDIYHQDVEVGCVNYRGNHDLYQLSEKEKALYSVYQISLGLDRIVNLLDVQ